ncbi:phosphoribosyltransferase [Flavobacteriaceae bacterium F08102]|nr:phosphoribosyltransferase [Flavobacteriaceae bacterium F08102]
MQRSIILDHLQIEHKVRRIAFQIYESNAKEKEVVVAGISKNGFILAKQLAAILSEISNLKVILCEVTMDKENPRNEIHTSLKPNEYAKKSLVLVDDVLNSGTTLIYAVKFFLEVPLKRIKTAVLVNRNHKKYPIKADFKGLSLSTSLQEHITVELNDTESIAYLN